MDSIDRLFKKIDSLFKKVEEDMVEIEKNIDNKIPKFKSPNPFWFYKTTITYSTQLASNANFSKCPKCNNLSMSGKYVKVDNIRDCLLFSCHSCGFQDTQRTKDNPGKFDLPTSEEAMRSLNSAQKTDSV